jgi:hypothetical protein
MTEPQSDSSDQSITRLPEARPIDTVLSRLAFVFLCVCAGLMAWFIPGDRRSFVEFFAPFGAKLPPATMMALNIPDIAFLLQVFVRTKSVAAVFHLFMTVLSCIAFIAYRDAMTTPMTSLIQVITGAHVR